jgi:hypothetical protein
MRQINSNNFYIASLELSPLETLLYSTALSYVKSIIFSKVPIFPFSHSVRERPLGALPNIINIKKKHTVAFNISSSVGFNLGLLPYFILYYLPPVSILYQNSYILLLRIDAMQNDLAIELSLALKISSLVKRQ